LRSERDNDAMTAKTKLRLRQCADSAMRAWSGVHGGLPKQSKNSGKFMTVKAAGEKGGGKDHGRAVSASPLSVTAGHIAPRAVIKKER
jgi:hypothetical protein